MKSAFVPELDLVEIANDQEAAVLLESVTRYLCHKSERPGDFTDTLGRAVGELGDHLLRLGSTPKETVQ